MPRAQKFPVDLLEFAGQVLIMDPIICSNGLTAFTIYSAMQNELASAARLTSGQRASTSAVMLRRTQSAVIAYKVDDLGIRVGANMGEGGLDARRRGLARLCNGSLHQ